LPCYPGRLWRRATTAVAGHSAGGVSRRKTGTGDGFLGAWNRGRADAWAGGGGVDYRQLQLAMGVLHQCPDRRYCHNPDPVVCFRSGLSAAQGQQEDWFSSDIITTLAVLAAVGLGGLIVRELMTDHPIIDLTVFKYRSYAIGTFLMTVVGFVLYGSTVLLPLLMQQLLGYTATHAGVTNFPRGFASFLAMPFIGILTNKVDTRKLLFSGVLLSAAAMYMLSRLSLDVGFWNFWWPLMLQGAALGLIFVPLTTVTHDPIPRER